MLIKPNVEYKKQDVSQFLPASLLNYGASINIPPIPQKLQTQMNALRSSIRKRAGTDETDEDPTEEPEENNEDENDENDDE